MSILTLLREGNPLAKAEQQRTILEGPSSGTPDLPRFETALESAGVQQLRRGPLTTLQVNVGKLCNQTCRHCHVDAGPDRRELMARGTFEECLRLVQDADIGTVDITGGAPEMNPEFEWFVSELRDFGRHVIDRCNLTILSAPGFQHLPKFLADHNVEIVASLPCYLESNCDSQRGDGVFRKSIEALQILNRLGYGQPDGELVLSLVYNPTGPSLPPDQRKLEQAYREQLSQRYGIEFTRLYTITNMPISRFLDDLLSTGRYEEYMNRLVSAFNHDAIDGLMCRSTLSVDWQGYLYDCDFNQMLELPLISSTRLHIRDVTAGDLRDRKINTGRHCFGCTAGAGSSCQGALT
ncbi:MAG: arsenosugar biosynthesis radical SAM protein ArsS [Planctomyces sp.]|nr:arsenosugar biosynthesis radical SAM protein ArsS [Planctomyces sp.]